MDFNYVKIYLTRTEHFIGSKIMSRLLDKSILLALCMILYFQNISGLYVVVPVIIAVILSAQCSYLEKDPLHIACFTAFSAACIFIPPFLFFLPLICYDIFIKRWWWVVLLSLPPIISNLQRYSIYTDIGIAVLIVLAYLIKRRGVMYDEMRVEYLRFRDDAREFTMNVERKNKELLEKQDYEVNLATLNERNRIARDIHDSVGHTLSSSILQIGALIATCRDERLKESLNTLRATLSQGMDSIRESIHDLYEESVDLYTETQKLVRDFSFCPIELDYDIEESPDKKIKYAFLTVIKEGLANIIKHSDATQVKVTLREHPALYQLIIKDNGTVKAGGQTGGIGLKNIAERIKSINGITNISSANGFTLFISVPKGGNLKV